ncbi:MAG: hypothetical protein ACRC0J_05810 [Shewanella oncorhynchi]
MDDEHGDLDYGYGDLYERKFIYDDEPEKVIDVYADDWVAVERNDKFYAVGTSDEHLKSGHINLIELSDADEIILYNSEYVFAYSVAQCCQCKGLNHELFEFYVWPGNLYCERCVGGKHEEAASDTKYYGTSDWEEHRTHGF